jgi:hypothetical protein
VNDPQPRRASPPGIRRLIAPLLPLAVASCAAGGGAARPAPLPAAATGPMVANGGPHPPPPPSDSDTAGPAFPRVPPGGWCQAAIPDSLLTKRDTVYLHALVLAGASRQMLPEADVLAQRVAAQLRELLGGRADSLPTGEPEIGWRNDIGGNVALVVQRDGRAAWHELRPPSHSDTLAVHALGRAVAATVAGGEMVSWGRESALDSVALRLGFDTHQEPNYQQRVGLGFAVFAQREPQVTRPELASRPSVEYPAWLLQAGVMGHLLMQAIIDTLGRAEPASVRDLWPEQYPRFEGREEEEYQAFVASARQTLLSARFKPGRLGPCLVRVRVQIPFNFGIAR